MSASASVPLPDADGMPGALRGGEFGLERLDFRAEHVPAAGDDAIDGRGNRRRILAGRGGRERNARLGDQRSAHACSLEFPESLPWPARSTYRSKCWR